MGKVRDGFGFSRFQESSRDGIQIALHTIEEALTKRRGAAHQRRSCWTIASNPAETVDANRVDDREIAPGPCDHPFEGMGNFLHERSAGHLGRYHQRALDALIERFIVDNLRNQGASLQEEAVGEHLGRDVSGRTLGEPEIERDLAPRDPVDRR